MRVLLINRLFSSLVWLFVLAGPGSVREALSAEPADSWHDVIRSTSYADSQGMAANLSTIRRWVLFGESYCVEQDRHLLFDKRWQFLGYQSDEGSSESIITNLNSSRRQMAEAGRVDSWIPGTTSSTGYPFALACDQPFTDMDEAIARVTGGHSEYRLWGTWDGMTVGSEQSQVSLLELFEEVVDFRRQQDRFTFPESVLPAFLGKIMIESGGQKDARSSVDAIGILQLLPAVLDDCEIPPGFHTHRIAQVDCALRLMEQNHRNLQPVFQEYFGHLPPPKQTGLYDLLLTQAYQIGVGRTMQLISDNELGRAAAYFAEYHENFSAEDIMAGMIFHNLGRSDIGLLSLYYVTDSRLALGSLCAGSSETLSTRWCPGN